MSRPVDPFIALSSGGKFYPLGPDPDRINIVDIAHSLSQQCRYAGHTSEFWSVAAHSIEVSLRVERYCLEWIERNEARDPRAYEYMSLQRGTGFETAKQAGLVALLHDASEAYLQDIVRPIKPLVHGYAMWEANVERAIAQRFGLPDTDGTGTHLVKFYDDEICLDEVAQFFPPGSAAWRRYGITERRSNLQPLTPAEGKVMFLVRFHNLGGNDAGSR